MRFHVPALAGQPAHSENSHCAYSTKVQRFASMMFDRGHEVYLYGMGESDARCTEFVPCYPELDRAPPFSLGDPDWNEANDRAIEALKIRQRQGDFLCVIAGGCQQPIAEATGLPAVEYGIGYSGTFARFRVFESYAWMHAMYGGRAGDPASADGDFYDAVIPNYFDLDQFHAGDDDGYLLYVGRMIARKGVDYAVAIAQAAGLDLVLAGGEEHRPGTGQPGIDYIGPVGPEDRATLMAHATALLVPTQYLEPFGGVAVEAQLCGTPAITTDWGAFTETVIHGQTGFRCRTLGEFVRAVELAPMLDRDYIRDRAQANYSMERVGSMYEQYFAQVRDLDGDGFYSRRVGRDFGTRYGTSEPAARLDLSQTH